MWASRPAQFLLCSKPLCMLEYENKCWIVLFLYFHMLCACRNPAQILSNGSLKTVGVDVAQGRYFFKAAIRTVISVLFLAAPVNRHFLWQRSWSVRMHIFVLKVSEGGRWNSFKLACQIEASVLNWDCFITKVLLVKKEANTLPSHSRSVIGKQKDIRGMKLRSVKNLFPVYSLLLSLCDRVKGGWAGNN